MNMIDEQILRRFRTKERVFRLTDDEVQELKQVAEQGDAYAQYGYGRWLYYHNPFDGALLKAEQLFTAAKDVLPDALMARQRRIQWMLRKAASC